MVDDIKDITTVNEEITNQSVRVSYPYVELTTETEALALVVPSLPKGSIPIVFNYKGVDKCVGKTELLARELNKLVRISGVVLHLSENDSMPLDSTESILDGISKCLGV